MEIRFLLQEALQNSLATIVEVGRDFGEVFGRSYNNLFWEDRVGDAEIVMVAMGSLAMEAIVAADTLRQEGLKVDILGIRVFRPFPRVALANALKKARLIIVFDKNISYGSEGATCSEIKAALYGSGSKAIIKNFIVGLGGRDVKARDLVDAVKQSIQTLDRGIPAGDYPEWLCQI
jgi:pyruvate/2-oxoacid:ferredoxin oxidoreductase alpha subunit